MSTGPMVAQVEPRAARHVSPHGLRLFALRYSRHRMGMLGLTILLVALSVALLAPVIAPNGPSHLYDSLLAAPGSEHPLGTDNIGRDVFSELVWGTRISLMFAVGVAGISLMIGVVLGALPAYVGGWVDDLFSRFFEIVIVIPRFFLIILVVSLFGQNIAFIMVVVGLTTWVTNARLTRSQVLTIKHRLFVEASQGAGAGRWRVLLTHVLPNGLYPVIANSALEMAGAIIIEASLSFLGLGDPNAISWGQVLYLAQLHISSWWLGVFPGVAIFLLVFAFNLIGDGVGYALNPRLRERS